jgi:hypothetical protein
MISYATLEKDKRKSWSAYSNWTLGKYQRSKKSKAHSSYLGQIHSAGLRLGKAERIIWIDMACSFSLRLLRKQGEGLGS